MTVSTRMPAPMKQHVPSAGFRQDLLEPRLPGHSTEVAEKGRPGYRHRKPARHMPVSLLDVSHETCPESTQPKGKGSPTLSVVPSSTMYNEFTEAFVKRGGSTNHGTTRNHWDAFRGGTDRPAQWREADLEDDLREFVGYLLSLGTMGGSTIQSYVALLPAALAGRDGLLTPSMRIPRMIKRLTDVVAKEIAPKHPLQRGAATLKVVCQVAADAAIPIAVRAAIVAQYHLGFRGINVYITKKGSKQRALHWGDCTPSGQKHSAHRVWTIRVRKEKTARTYVGTFPDKVLAVPNEASTPCPVAALDKMYDARKSDDPDACVFPAVNYKKVAEVLRKHSPTGQRLTPHSIRIGAATDVKDAGLSERVLQAKGNWATPQSANRYVRGSMVASKAEMSALATLLDGHYEQSVFAPAGLANAAAAAAAASEHSDIAASSAQPTAVDSVLARTAEANAMAQMQAAAAAVAAPVISGDLLAAVPVPIRAGAAASAEASHPALPSQLADFEQAQAGTGNQAKQLHASIWSIISSSRGPLLIAQAAKGIRAYFYDSLHKRCLYPRIVGRRLGNYQPYSETNIQELLNTVTPFVGEASEDLLKDLLVLKNSGKVLSDRRNPAGQDAVITAPGD